MLHQFSGAHVRRTIDRSHAEVPEHAHDWPLLSLFVMGAYSNSTELGEQLIAGPSAVFYAAGAPHSNRAAAEGFEQIEIEFDPAWLKHSGVPDSPVSRWIGGATSTEAHTLALACNRELTEAGLRTALRRFFERALGASPVPRPDWISQVAQRLKADTASKVSGLAREVGLHPSWLGSAYKCAMGEGPLETAARFRVEHAARLLRETELPYTDIALDSGFCDQSHMIRTFRRMLGRLPSAVRDDRSQVRQRRSEP
jgi:AraC-like DNA-binding protein